MELFVGKKGVSILNSTGNFSVQDRVQVSMVKGVLHISINLSELLYSGANESAETSIAPIREEVAE